ncbi:MAG: hypothetical protein RL172_1770 [Bacteroidota bacterium]|jgi:hypothetical protein
MKKLTIISNCIIGLTITASSFAQQGASKYEFVKTKAFNKTYNVGASDKLNIQNSFGKVELYTWNKNEIKVDVAIEASSNMEPVAQKIIDGITVSASQSGGEVAIKTSIGNINNKKGEKSSMKVDYVVYMPAGNPLKLSNEFGAITVPDLKGSTEIVSKFGSLKAGHLADVKKLEIEFGSADIASINNGTTVIKYSAAIIGKLSGAVKLNVEFSSAVKIVIDNSLTSLDAKASYATLNLKPAAGLAAAYSIHTSFGELKNRSGIKFTSDDDGDEHGPKFDHQYEGKTGNANVSIKIKSDFGNIILGEATKEELTEEENKAKKKTKTT